MSEMHLRGGKAVAAGELGTVLLLGETKLRREQLGYVNALVKRGWRLIRWKEERDSRVGETITSLSKSNNDPVFVLHPEDDPVLPRDLTDVEVPTGCFFIDTFSFLEHRRLWGQLFDHIFVFHPGFETSFRESGHPSVTLLPHAIDPLQFSLSHTPREFEVGWVGRIKGPLYQRRRQILPLLETEFKMNSWRRIIDESEVPNVYGRSKIVVNVSRDDWPKDANLRTFEAMASGALLITHLPSELEDLGLVEGKSFVGFKTRQELIELIRYFLKEDVERETIANAGRDCVFSMHTYDHRIDVLLSVMLSSELNGPARRWTSGKIAATYFDYFASHRRWSKAIRYGAKGLVLHPGAVAKLLSRSAVKRIHRDRQSSVREFP